MRLPAVIALILAAPLAFAQANAFNAGRVPARTADNNAFNAGRAGNFNDYRADLNAEYARMLGERWNDFNSVRGSQLPDRDVPPVPPVQWQPDDDDGRDEEIVIDEVVAPVIDNNPVQPIAPVRDENQPADVESFSFSYLSTPMSVRMPRGTRFRLGGTSEADISAAWNQLSAPAFSSMVADCQRLKGAHKLCDWAYLQMLEQLGKAYCSDDNSATMLMAYVFSQSGYRMRLGEQNGRLDLLFASRHMLFDRNYYNLDGEKYYPYYGRSGTFAISSAEFPRTQSLSLWVPQSILAEERLSPERTVTSSRYPEFSTVTSVNRNLIDFYDSYPTSEVGGNFMTRWAMYANTPMSERTRNTLYPRLRSLISGLDELQAVERILNWVQTGFVYGYDSEIWGADRAFFPEETLYYPYCDCEDRSILFTRIIRDLLGLKCVLIYYPGHLAAAVNFTDAVSGDYITHGGRRFTITDPTYIGARVGATMPQMNNATAKAILLE